LYSQPQDYIDFHKPFLPSVKTLTKSVIFVFLLVQTFLKKKALPKKQGFSFAKRKSVS